MQDENVEPGDNENFLNRLAQALNNYNRPQSFENFDALKRVKYENVKTSIQNEEDKNEIPKECPICIMPFTEDSEKDLIYLP